MGLNNIYFFTLFYAKRVFIRAHLGINQLYGNTKHLLPLGYAQSDGYAKNTDYSTLNLFYSSEYLLNLHPMHLFILP